MSMPGLNRRHGRPTTLGQPSPGPVGQSAQLGNDLITIFVGKVIWLRTELKLLLNLQCCPPGEASRSSSMPQKQSKFKFLLLTSGLLKQTNHSQKTQIKANSHQKCAQSSLTLAGSYSMKPTGQDLLYH